MLSLGGGLLRFGNELEGCHLRRPRYCSRTLYPAMKELSRNCCAFRLTSRARDNDERENRPLRGTEGPDALDKI